jgi:hypothetical protein
MQIEPCISSFALRCFLPKAHNGDQDHGLTPWLFSDQTCCRKSVRSRQFDIYEDNVRPESLGNREQRSGAVRHSRLVAH